ncbi:hypothetical protein, partial [Klebsiella pneumoniae]|uniref:hypothetical protein n=1 Tax=Klebsiella pneumoniae TaxID=573 RepID=UPI002730B477
MSSQEMVVERPSGWLHGRLGTVVLWALLIGFESAGQLFTKVAGDQLGQMDLTWQWLAVNFTHLSRAPRAASLT